MKLWAVHYADYGDDGVVAIFDSAEAANDCYRRCQKDKRYCHFIHEYILNDDPTKETK